ncbi:unnamed protein product, partial [Dicrocoelium dendriticum]
MYNVWEYEDMSSSPYWTRVMVIVGWSLRSFTILHVSPCGLFRPSWAKIVPPSNPRSPRCPGPQRKGKVGDNREKTARTGMELNIVNVLCYNIC